MLTICSRVLSRYISMREHSDSISRRGGSFRVEIGAEFAIDSRKHVLVEFRRHSLSVIVGWDKTSRFHQVGSEQQCVPCAEDS